MRRGLKTPTVIKVSKCDCAGGGAWQGGVPTYKEIVRGNDTSCVVVTEISGV